MLSQDQLDQLVHLVQSVSLANQDEANATAASNEADVALAKATTDAHDAKIVEANAQAATSAAIVSLETFVDGLAAPAPAPAPAA